MKLFRPGFPPIFSGEDEKDQPAPPVKPKERAAPGLLSPEQAIAAANARHAASGVPPVQQPPRSTDNLIPTQQTGVPTQVIPTVTPQPLIDKAAQAVEADKE